MHVCKWDDISTCPLLLHSNCTLLRYPRWTLKLNWSSDEWKVSSRNMTFGKKCCPSAALFTDEACFLSCMLYPSDRPSDDATGWKDVVDGFIKASLCRSIVAVNKLWTDLRFSFYCHVNFSCSNPSLLTVYLPGMTPFHIARKSSNQFERRENRKPLS